MENPENKNSTATAKRLIAIVGRPNVGKSALFNALAGKRLAIVFDQPGVTRDRVAREVEICSKRFMLVDTGGLSFDKQTDRDDPLREQTRIQAELAVNDASACVVVTDAKAGMTALDEEVISRIRSSGIPAVIAANKCDNPQEDANQAEFAATGFKVFPVSASHKRGLEALSAEIASFIPDTPPEEDSVPLRVAVVGRPNAGKSSFINRLLNEDRVIVSPAAGTTRDTIDIPFTIGSGPNARRYILTDTAGIRPRGRTRASSVEAFSIMRAEQAVKDADVVILAMDPELGPTFQDKRIASQIIEENKACVLLMQKWDLAQAKGITETKAAEAFRKMMPFLSFAPLVFCSNKTGYNIRRSIDAVDQAAASTRTRMPTGLLNRTLEDAVKRTQPPLKNGKRLKIFYALQVGTSPLTLRLFVNDPKLLSKNYLTYLEKAVRSRFGLEGAPLRIFLKARRRDTLEDMKARKTDADRA